MVVEHLAELLVRGKTEECWELLIEYKQKGMNSLYLFEQLITPVMRHIGKLWENNQLSVADEHLASGIIDVLLTRYAATCDRAPDNGLRAMFFCVEGEAHYLGLKMVSLYFEELGWNVRFYGPNLPLEHTLSSAAKWKPDVIGLSATMTYHLRSAKDYIEKLERLPHRPAVLLGGRLVQDYPLDSVITQQTIVISSFVDLHSWLNDYINTPVLQKQVE